LNVGFVDECGEPFIIQPQPQANLQLLNDLT
jgi:hypothetical protein